MNSPALAAIKASLAAGEICWKSALQKVCEQADKALKAGPFSVVEKKWIPPSGDRHDYLSLGLYWWPDPKKKSGLPYIRRDGKINPENQAGSNRMPLGRMTLSVETLALAYYLTKHEPYADHAAYLLRSWFLEAETRMNPNLQFSQTIPGRNRITGLGIIDSLTFTCVIDAMGLLEASPAWTDRDRQGMKSWFEEFLIWLQTSPHGKKENRRKNNHGTWYDVQLVSYALFLGQTELARQRLETCKRRRIKRQIRSDGRQPYALKRTRAFYYSVYNLCAFFDLATMAMTLGLDLWHYETKDGRGVRKALDFIVRYTEPGQSWPYPETKMQWEKMLPLLRRAVLAYREPAYEALVRRDVHSPGKTTDEMALLETFCRARQHQLEF